MTPLETLSQCPVCSDSHFSPYLQPKDYTVSGKEFQIVACKGCGFLFTNPRPDSSSIGQYYESTDYISHHDEAKDFMSNLYTRVRNFTTQQKIQLIEKQISGKGSLLDVGCGAGFFLSKAKEAGWKVSGTEPDQQARAISQSRVGDSIYESIEDPRFENQHYDIITMWHVLEHVHRLNETMEWLHEHLHPNGKLIIAVPNPESDDAARFKEHWAAYDVPRHLYHFSKKSLQGLAMRHSFEVVEVLPMWFDSYYVSMLSTRYQQGKTNLPESVWRGTFSNIKGRGARDRKPNTSSLIYILSKA